MPLQPGTITVVGLGPGNRASRTIETQDALDSASKIFLRTGIHPGMDDLLGDPRTSTCDDLYSGHDSFDAVYAAIVKRLLDAAMSSDIVYAVPGNPTYGERTVAELRSLAAETGVQLRILAAVSALDEIATRLGFDPMADELQLIDAARLSQTLDQEPFSAGHLHIDPYRPALIGQVYSSDLAIAVKLALTRVYGDDHLVTVLRAAGVPGQEVFQTIRLNHLDRHPVDHLTSVWVPPVGELEGHRTEANVAQVIARLRAPGGCPWDRKQTHQSLRDAVLDEAYEVADAIDADDLDNLAEELGDLFLLVMLHSQIATEAGHFTIEDVYEGLSRKLIRRHPHVFGDVEADTPADVVRTWNQIKSNERAGKAARSLYDKLPRSMPAMLRAIKLIKSEQPQELSGTTQATPGGQLLMAISGMIAEGIDPEHELSTAIAEVFGQGAKIEGIGGS